MNHYKKLHNKWHVELKDWFHKIQGDIPFCEICGTTKMPLDMAHSRKRFDIKTKVQYFHAAMLCRTHHNQIELGKTHQEMYDAINAIRNEGSNCQEAS